MTTAVKHWFLHKSRRRPLGLAAEPDVERVQRWDTNRETIVSLRRTRTYDAEPLPVPGAGRPVEPPAADTSKPRSIPERTLTSPVKDPGRDYLTRGLSDSNVPP